MTDFAGGFADWDLTAVVSGYSSAAASLDDNDHHLLFDNFVFSEYLFDDNYSNSDLELNDLYKPFYPPSNFDQYPFSPPPPTPSPPPPPPPATAEEMVMVKDEEKAEPIPVSSKAPVGTKYRIRKNQQKRVVMEVTGEGLSLDMWAWRKYGQKPIKGSPYPRSYYRCSSSKGCLARKMVERSHLNPTTFIITYTGDHNHAKPTRRNSLAGTTRQRFSPVPTPAAAAVAEETCSGYTENKTISDHMMDDDDDDRFVSPLTPSKSNDVGFYQELGDSSFW